LTAESTPLFSSSSGTLPFVNIGTYLPYPVRVCLNGHHWAQQQLRRAGIAFDALDNGFRWCESPSRLQAVCDALGPSDVQTFFDRWVDRLPWPLTQVDRAAGYRHRLSLWQVEVSFTQISASPCMAAACSKPSCVRTWIWVAQTESACSSPPV
jgi:hypothetical protein